MITLRQILFWSFFWGALACVFPLGAQQSVNSGGSDAVGSGGSFSYTVGQVDYVMMKSDRFWANQGVQQPKIVDGNFPQTTCIIYPNPATSLIQVGLPDDNLNPLNYQIFDVLGRLQRHTEQWTLSESVYLDGLSEGIYFLVVKNDQNNEKWTCKFVMISL